jgi:glycosyltransferase involved in cell wall biosynthesis
MNNKFALSVLLPLYMDETFPEELVYRNVDSLISQTFDDFEIVISDDLPGDKSEKLLQHIRSQSSVCFKYVVNKEQKGIASNTMSCFRQSEGQLIHSLQQDDWLSSPFFYENMTLQLEKGFTWGLMLPTSKSRTVDGSFGTRELLGINLYCGLSGLLTSSDCFPVLNSNYSILCDLIAYVDLYNKHGSPQFFYTDELHVTSGVHQEGRKVSEEMIIKEITQSMRMNKLTYSEIFQALNSLPLGTDLGKVISAFVEL